MEIQTKLYAGYSIGRNCYEKVDHFCSPYGTRVLLIGEKIGMEKGLPILEKALKSTGSKLLIIDTEDYGTECTEERILELTDRYREKYMDMVFGMGGGKAMDTAKSVAKRLGLPVFTFPTIASNCAAMSALSVLYKKDGSFDYFDFQDAPAVHCFMETDLLIQAPARFIRAGMGDTIAKYFECWFAARGDELDFHSALGRQISTLCYERIHSYAGKALEEMECGVPGDAFEQIVLTIVVNTGLVSHLVEDCYNCAVAHSVCYGLDLIPGMTDKYLHGDLVGYGVLVQLCMDKEVQTALEVRELLRLLQIPVSMEEMGIAPERETLENVLEEIVSGPDMEHIPYSVNKDMIWEAMKTVEQLGNFKS
jgi:glycerol dehydrogenase